MQFRQTKKRRLSIQNLETRMLFAADVGLGDLANGHETQSDIGEFRPGQIQRPVLGPIAETCPPCELESSVEASTLESPQNASRSERKIEFTITIEPVNDMPFEFNGDIEQGGG